MYEIMVALTLKLMTEALNLEPVNPARIQRQLRMFAHDRVGLLDLDGEARESILRSLDEARVQGLNEDQMIELIKDRVPSGRWSSPEVRSQILVRTEARMAQNLAVTTYAREAGIDRVLILDARLGPTDAECEARNGWVVSPSEGRALAGIEHPNGTLAILPLAQEDTRDTTEGQPFYPWRASISYKSKFDDLIQRVDQICNEIDYYHFRETKKLDHNHSDEDRFLHAWNKELSRLIQDLEEIKDKVPQECREQCITAVRQSRTRLERIRPHFKSATGR
jgi:hypothetical protein